MEAARTIGKTAEHFAEGRNAPLIFLPIQRGHNCDVDALRSIMPDRVTALDTAANIVTPAELVRQVQQCRLVVTGSYHAGVFALSNGIPVLGLAGSDYYVDKFEGLADMFGEGCRVLRVDEKDYAEELRSAVETLWEGAEKTRPGLLAAAERQIALARASYERIAKLIMDARTPR
jgi:colanic acid/amylovoran biosynthesis protein